MEEKNEYESGTEIELDQINIILKIPMETVRLEVTASIMDDNGEQQKVHTTLPPSKIREARQDFLNNVEFGDEYDAIWTLTDKGREMIVQHETDEDGLWDGIGIIDLGGK